MEPVAVQPLPDIAVLSSQSPAPVDQRPTAVVTRVGLQADLPRPEEGAGLLHVPHKSFTSARHGRQVREAQRFNTPEALLLPTLLLCYPGEKTPSCAIRSTGVW